MLRNVTSTMLSNINYSVNSSSTCVNLCEKDSVLRMFNFKIIDSPKL